MESSLTNQRSENPLLLPNNEGDLPALPHGLPDPNSFLPTISPWIWALGIAFLCAIIIGLGWLIFRSSKKHHPVSTSANPFQEALSHLETLERSLEGMPLSQIATETSLIVRRYFAATLSEPALYETTEEFQSRQIDLPQHVAELLNRLSNAKYSRSANDHRKGFEFVSQAKNTLNQSHSAREPVS